MMRIICYGDSNTFGYDPRLFFGGRYDEEDRWPERLGRLTGWTVINAGVNGREIPHSRAPWPEDADLILVMLGTNDLLQGASAEEAAARMERFLSGSRRVLLIAPPPMKRGAWVPNDALVAESIRLADCYATLGLPVIDTREWGIELCFDGVHFTEAGHRRLAEKLCLTLPLRDPL